MTQAETRMAWWEQIKYGYADAGDNVHAKSVALARQRPLPPIAEYRVELASLRAQIRKLWRREALDHPVLVELGIRRVAAQAQVTIEGQVTQEIADDYREAFN